jgi:glycosyltransferase involved in cell wall biosynthesis
MNASNPASIDEQIDQKRAAVEVKSGSAAVRCRVAHLTTVHWSRDVRIVGKECHSLVRAGYDVTFIGYFDENGNESGVQIKGLGKAKGRVSRMLWAPWKVYREAIRQNATIYHFHDPELLLVGILLRIKGKRVIYDAHEDISEDIAVKGYLPGFVRRPLARVIGALEKMCARKFSGVVTATTPIAERFRGINPRTVVVHNYPELAELAPPSEKPWASRKMAAVYVGSIVGDRGAREMVNAMALLPGDSAKASLELAGHFASALQAELSKLPGWEKVRVHGLLGRAEVAQLLGDARVGLVVLSATPAFIHSAPIKLFEYMSAGIPMVASDFPGFREIVVGRECGLVVDPADPRKIAEAIDYLLSNPGEAEQMGQRGRRAVEEKYNWASEEQKLLKLYAEVAAS